jgi:metallo-beta-lactamase family protein
VEDTDILLMESTYGDRLHQDKDETHEEFKRILLESRNRKGNIIIPSFAIERTQEIIYHLGRLVKSGEIPPVPVYVDSPLATSATEIFKKYRDLFDTAAMKILFSGDNPLEFPNLHYTRTREESKRLNVEARGAIIISASGMCTAGRVKHHLLNNLYRPESSVVFVGFQAEGTLGRRLVDGEKRVQIYGEDVAVKAKIHTLGGFSAHADRDGLLEWMGSMKNNKVKVFVVHGEEKAAESFAGSVRQRFGYETRVPRWGEIVDTETMFSTFTNYGAEAPSGLDREMEDLKGAMAALVEKYNRAKSENRIFQSRRLEQDLNDLAQKAKMISKEL